SAPAVVYVHLESVAKPRKAVLRGPPIERDSVRSRADHCVKVEYRLRHVDGCLDDVQFDGRLPPADQFLADRPLEAQGALQSSLAEFYAIAHVVFGPQFRRYLE